MVSEPKLSHPPYVEMAN